MRFFRSRSRLWGSVCAAAAITAAIVAIAAAGPSTRSAKAQGLSCTPGTVVQTRYGPVCGITTSGVNEWLGIPYAAPPVGSLRWQPPQAPTPWTTTLPATAFGNECTQGTATSPAGSEDCLYLNVVSPSAPAPAGGRPVLVHIHGGGFVGGNGNGDYSSLATAGNEVVVSMNYRLGIFGFLADSALGPHSGDYGLQDQQFALRWVQQNIEAFGGDPHNVTIFGESAGGSSICDQVASPTAAGLFEKGISVSGEYNNPFGVPGSAFDLEVQDCKSALPTQRQANRIGAGFAAASGCSTATDVGACLRNLSVADVLQVADSGYQYGGQGTIGPTLNGTTLRHTLRQELATGDVNRVPIIAGTDRDENLVGLPTTDAEYQQLVQTQYGSLAPRVLALYPASHFTSPFVAWRTVAADSDTVCPALVTDRDLARWMPVYGYEIDDGNAPPASFEPANEPNGSYHVADWYVYTGVSGGFPTPPPDANEADLQAQEIAEVTTFGDTGQPRALNTPPWPQFNSSQRIMSLAPGDDSQVLPAGVIDAIHHCGFWDAVSPNQ
jgi:para-nitrobenzyl esterase